MKQLVQKSTVAEPRVTTTSRKLLESWLPELLMTALVIVFLGDCWVGGRTLAMRDFFIEYQPYASRFFQSLVTGSASCWDSARQCGIPRMAQPAETPFYPPALVFGFRSADTAAIVNWTFHIAVAAIGAHALARHWGLVAPAALLSGVGFALNTYVVCFLEFQCGFVSLVWLPLVILLLDRIMTRSQTAITEAMPPDRASARLLATFGSSIAGLALALAFQLLGIGEYFYYSVLLASLFWMGFLVFAVDYRRAAVGTACLFCAGTLGLCVAMPQLAMTLELLPLSDRAGEVDAIVSGTSAHPRHWLTFLLPFLYGRPGYPAATWAPDIYELAVGHCYVGLMPLTLAYFAVAALGRKGLDRNRRRVITTLVIIGVFGLLMAAGKFTPVYAFLHAWLPGLKHFRMPTKFYFFVAFSLSMLGGIGLDELLKAPAGDRINIRCWRGAVIVAVVLACVGLAAAGSHRFLVAFMAHPGEPSIEQIDQFWNDFALAAVFFLLTLGTLAVCMGPPDRRGRAAAVVVAVAFLNLLVVSRQMHPTTARGLYSQRPVQLGRAVGNGAPGRILPLNWNAQQWLYGKRERVYWDWARNAGVSAHVLLEGASRVTPNGLGIRRYSQLFGAMMSGPPAIQNRIANMMSVRFVITGPRFADVYWAGATTEVTVAERADYLPRAQLVDRWSVVSDGDTALERVMADDFDPAEEAVVENDGIDSVSLANTSPNQAASADRGTVSNFRDDGDVVAMDVDARRQSLLVLADTWYPGWRAMLDGIEVPIVRTNFLFRGVLIEPGKHHLEFTYRPRWLWPSLTVSGIAMILLSGLATAPWLKRRLCAGSIVGP